MTKDLIYLELWYLIRKVIKNRLLNLYPDLKKKIQTPI